MDTTTAGRPPRCWICLGRVASSIDRVECFRCGRTYHIHCARRLRLCTICGVEILAGAEPGPKRFMVTMKPGCSAWSWTDTYEEAEEKAAQAKTNGWDGEIIDTWKHPIPGRTGTIFETIRDIVEGAN